MSKWPMFSILLVVACIAAGMYGALHNQISYTVSPDYFHAYKFDQFNIPEALHNRLGASVVGWGASWWMGLFIGVPVLMVGRELSGTPGYVKHCLIAFAVVAITALIAGVIALSHAYATIEAGALPAYRYPSGVTDRVAFARAGAMHNASYVGGLFGIVTASNYLVVVMARLRGRKHRSAEQSLS